MIFNIDGVRSKHFADAFVNKQYDATAVAYQTVRDKMREFIGNAEIVEVVCAGVDVTKEVMEFDKEFYKNEFYRLDSELPF